MIENSLDIAIVGINGRFPGAHSVETLWRNLVNGTESIQALSDQALAEAGVSPDLIAHPDYVKAGAFLEGIEYFDADFFGFTPREAATMNPQQRLLLECAWEALERAGYDPGRFPGRIGVYAGSATNHYLAAGRAGEQDEVGALQAMIGNEPDYLATQVAYKLDLRGPALTVQTACSSSLVAVHLACQSLLNHECDLALAGGVAILLPQREGYLYVEGGINSPDGHCRAFDAEARGTVPGNGLGVVLLRRWADAIEAGDPILALIKATAINNDGAAKIGYTAPSQPGQANVIADALALAGLEAEDISYVETHGTGTALGDPIEFNALAQVFRESTGKTGFCKLGALKTNIGHLGAAAGVSGLIKTVLALQHRRIPPTLHFKAPNPKIDLAGSPFTINAEPAAWESPGKPRRAGVSSFGVGGTNAHAILEEAPPPGESGASRPWQLLVWSAKTPEALARMTGNLLAHLEAHPDMVLGDAAYTLQTGRRRFKHGHALVCRTLDEAVAALARPSAEALIPVSRQHESRAVVFMFPGQGAQYPDMGHELYQHEKTFRQTVDQCAELLEPHLGLDLREILFAAETGRDEAAARLQQTALAQPALFVIEYALARLWMSFGLVPQAMIGHSIGEYVAACLAGVFSLADALLIVAARGRLMQATAEGAMLAVALGAEELTPFLNGALSLAAVNTPGQSVLAGTREAVAALEAELARRGVKTARLPTSRAFHSALLEPMLAPYTEIVARTERKPPSIPFLSNLTGAWIQAGEAVDPGYWARHARGTVEFSAGLSMLLRQPEWILLEVGPGTTLGNLARAHAARDAGQTVLASLPHAKDTRSAQQILLQSLGQLYLQGVEVDWAGFYREETRRRVLLPTYPFQRQRHWLDRPATPAQAEAKLPLEEWFALPAWRQTAPARLLPPAEARSPVLLLADGYGLGAVLAERLQARGRAVLTLTPGSAFAEASAGHYRIDPARPEDYRALLRALGEKDLMPGLVLHLWQWGPSAQGEPDDLDAVCRTGFDSLLLLAQALGDRGDGQARRMIVVTSQSHAVLGEEAVEPEKALLMGCARVIAQEYPRLDCRCVDVAWPGDSRADAWTPIAGQLLEELASAGTDPVVAYRGARRWAQDFEPTRLEAPDRDPLRREGVYLLTAGLSATGLRLAEVLARSVNARLVLIDDREAETGELQALPQGTEFVALRAEVTDLRQMRDALAEATARFGRIDGVFHLPAATNDGLIQLKTLAGTRPVLARSLTGTQVLQRVLADRPVDFIALMGSTLSISGGIGQVDECAAHAYLDAYAQSRAHTPPAVVAIDWPLWRWDDRYERSMAEFLQVRTQFRAIRERFGLTEDETLESLRRILAAGQPQVVVSPKGIAAVLEQQRTLTLENVASQLAVKPVPASGEDTQGPRSEAPADELEAEIAQVWREVFGMAEIGRKDNFFDLGGHSLLSIQLISRLRSALRLQDLPLSLLFEAPTVADLAEAVRAIRQDASLDLEALASSEDAEVAALLAEIEGMSEEEILVALAGE